MKAKPTGHKVSPARKELVEKLRAAPYTAPKIRTVKLAALALVSPSDSMMFGPFRSPHR